MTDVTYKQEIFTLKPPGPIQLGTHPRLDFAATEFHIRPVYNTPPLSYSCFQRSKNLSDGSVGVRKAFYLFCCIHLIEKYQNTCFDIILHR